VSSSCARSVHADWTTQDGGGLPYLGVSEGTVKILQKAKAPRVVEIVLIDDEQEVAGDQIFGRRAR